MNIIYPLLPKQRAALARLRDEGPCLIHSRIAGTLKDYGYAVKTDQPCRRASSPLMITELGRKRLNYPG